MIKVVKGCTLIQTMYFHGLTKVKTKVKSQTGFGLLSSGWRLWDCPVHHSKNQLLQTTVGSGTSSLTVEIDTKGHFLCKTMMKNGNVSVI